MASQPASQPVSLAMAAIGIAENLTKGENVVVARGDECEVHTSRLGTRGTSRASGGGPNAEGEKL